MKIICDIGIIRGESWSTIEGLKDQLHVPKIAVRELLGTSDWKGTDHERVVSTLKKIQFLQKDTHLNLIQPEEIVLSASGITSLPSLPSASLQHQILDNLTKNTECGREELVRWLQRWIEIDGTWETSFPGIIGELLSSSHLSIHKRKGDLKFHQLAQVSKNVYMAWLLSILRHVLDCLLERFTESTTIG